MTLKASQLWIVETAGSLSDLVRQFTRFWSKDSYRTIGQQLVRSADSVGANIVEGYGREYPRDSLRFYFIARGSLEETIYWLDRCDRAHLIPKSSCRQLIARYQLLSKALNNFIRTRPSGSD